MQDKFTNFDRIEENKLLSSSPEDILTIKFQEVPDLNQLRHEGEKANETQEEEGEKAENSEDEIPTNFAPIQE